MHYATGRPLTHVHHCAPLLKCHATDAYNSFNQQQKQARASPHLRRFPKIHHAHAVSPASAENDRPEAPHQTNPPQAKGWKRTQHPSDSPVCISTRLAKMGEMRTECQSATEQHLLMHQHQRARS